LINHPSFSIRLDVGLTGCISFGLECNGYSWVYQIHRHLKVLPVDTGCSDKELLITKGDSGKTYTLDGGVDYWNEEDEEGWE
jgi:hypothetical protein